MCSIVGNMAAHHVSGSVELLGEVVDELSGIGTVSLLSCCGQALASLRMFLR